MSKVVNSLATACLTAALVCGLAPGLSAQAGQGGVRGSIQDETRAVLPGVTVSARNTQTGASRSVVSDAAGRFELANLPAGTYEIDSVLLGFSSRTTVVTLGPGETRSLDLVLEISPLTESVNVTRTDQARRVVPTAVGIIDGDEIQFAQRQEALAETLRGIPGMFAENRRNFSMAGGVQATIRAPMVGFGMRGIQVLQDGIPLTTADGTTQPTNLDLGAAGQMEIVRGPNSVLYGNAAGGVISLRTEFPLANRLWIEPDIQFGSFGYQRQQVKAQGTSGRFSYLVNANRMQTDGYRRNSAGDVRRANVVLRGAMSSDTEIRGVFFLFDMPFGESASTLDLATARNNPSSVRQIAIDQGWGEMATQGQGGVTLEHHFGDGHMIRATGWATGRSVWNPIPGRIVDLGRKAGGLRSAYSGRRELGRMPVTWTTGLDISYQGDGRVEFVNAGVPAGGSMTTEGPRILDQLESVRSFAPFAQVTLTLRPQWFLTAGVRYDYYDFTATDQFLSDGDDSGGRTLDAASPMAGLTFAASDELNLYTNFATAYQTPTTVELSNKPTGEGGFNEDLNPADLRSFEVGARGLIRGGQIRYEVAAYFSTLDDAFVEQQRPDEQTYFRNAAAASRNGFEGRVDWTPIAPVRAYLSYTRQNFTFDRFEAGGANFSGNTEPGGPPHQLYLGGSYEAPFGLRSTLQYRWVDEYFVNNANTFTNWSYQIVDLRFGLNRRWNGVDLRPFIGIDNLFSERYNASSIPNSFGNRFYEPSPGREVYVGVRVGAGLF
jgi:iron complex outermembrane receptor protein